jgi:hexosaminidase
MKISGRIFSMVFMIVMLIACNDNKPSAGNAYEPSIIPQPVMMKLSSGDFAIKSNSPIYFDEEDLEASGKYLSSMFATDKGSGLQVKEGSGKGINLKIATEKNEAIGNEGYRLSIKSQNIEITANNKKGIFYGIQTLIQMLPVDYITVMSGGGEIKVQCAEIEDMPRFQWRGLLLDVARHFFTIDEIKRLIDQMAAYKFNILQLHLTDDQGWRIEIKSLPELTRTGSLRVTRTGLWWDRESPAEGEKATYGGYYTHEQIKDLVAYALERNVNILPEIEAPGHSLAAIASYPVLSSTGKKYKVNPGSKFYGIDDNSLCAGRETTYDYLDKVFTEVAELFPFEYIHIGGDECFKGFWQKCDSCRKRMKDNNLKDVNELQSYLVKRMEKILESKGKKLIGWDEILEGGLAPNAAVMSWRGMKGGIEAAKAGHKVVMSPVEYAYIDFYQGDPAIEPPTYAMLRFNKVYSFEPVPEGVDSSLVMGGQGNLWTESVPTFRHAEYMFWPRSFALAEVLWSPAKSRNWEDFVVRTEDHLKKLSLSDINYSVSFYDAIITPSKNDNGDLLIQLDTEIEGLSIYYTFDNTYPDHHSRLYKQGEKIVPDKDADTFRVITYRNGKPLGRIISVSLTDLAKRIG